VLPQDHELRRREESLARRESHLARIERDLAAREAELRCDEQDDQLRALLFGAQARARRSRLQVALVRIVPIVAGLWLMAAPLLFAGESHPVALASVAAGAALAFVGLAAAHCAFRERWAAWALGATGTWALAWAALGHGTAGGAWELAVTGVAVWLVALTTAAGRPG
jgi:hypothetical protein